MNKLMPLVALLVVALPQPTRAQAPALPPGHVGREISLAEAIDEALLGNPELALAENAGDAARAASLEARSALWPSLGLEAGYARSVDPVFAFGTKLRQSRFAQADFDLDALNDPDALEDWTARVGARWSVLNPQVWAGTAASRHAARSAEWSARRAREATVLTTRTLYYLSLESEAALDAARAAEEAARATTRVFRARSERGLLTEADLLQAEAELSAAEAKRAEAERVRLEALQNLGLQLGWAADTLPVPTDSLAEPVPRPDDGFEPEARADIRALSAAVDAAGAATSRASLSYAPALDLFASYGSHAQDPFSSDASDWTVGVGLRWTLFEGFARSARRQQAKLEQRNARIRYEDALQRARMEWEQARRAVESARLAARASASARAAAEAALRLMRRRFEEGLATPSELLQAEARATAMRERAIAALTGYHIAIARLDFVRSGINEEEDPR